MPSSEVLVELKANITEFANKMHTAAGEVEKLNTKGASGLQKLSTVGGAALAGLAAGFVAFAAVGLRAADELETSQARLETAVKNAGGSFDEQKGHIDALNQRMEKLGFTNADTEGTLSTLVNATHDVNKAIKDEGLAADIARGRHIDLATATTILSKVETGHVALLGRLGIQTKDVNGNLISQKEALQKLTDLYGGQASAYSKTFAGQMATLRATAEDLAAKFGLVLIPIIQSLASVISGTIQWFEKHKEVAIALGVAIGGPLVAAMTAFIALRIVGFVEAAVQAFATLGGMVARAAAAIAASIGPTQALAVADAELAVGEDVVAVSATGMWAAILAPITVVVAAIATVVAVVKGLYTAFTDPNGTVSIKKTGDLLGDVSKISTEQIKTINSLGQAHASFLALLKKSPEAAQVFLDKANAAGIATKGWAGELNKAATAAQRKHDADLSGANGAEAQATAIEDEKKALDEANKSFDAIAKTQKTYVDAVWGSVDAQKALGSAFTTLIKDTGDTSASQQQLRDDIESVVQAAGKNAEFQQGPGATALQKTKASYDAQIFTLSALRDHYPTLTPVINTWIEQLAGAKKAADDANGSNDAALTVLDNLKAKYPQLGPVIDTLENQLKALGGATDNLNNLSLQQTITVLDNLKAKFPQLIPQIAALEQALGTVSSPPPITLTLDTSAAMHKIEVFAAALGAVAGSPGYGLAVHFAAGGKAGGGPVEAHKGYVVGEKGPEYFVPNTSGYIVPNSKLVSAKASTGGGGGDVHVHLEGAIIGSQAEFDQIVMNSLYTLKRNGGSLPN